MGESIGSGDGINVTEFWKLKGASAGEKKGARTRQQTLIPFMFTAICRLFNEVVST
jgi:hypothetical protein